LTECLADDPIVAVACPRADFDAAVLEFLVGLYTVAVVPEDEAEWAERWRSPPRPEDIATALSRLPPAFSLDGDGPRVFQDLDPLSDVDPTPIENLLIGAPGEQSRRNNTDLFTKRDRVAQLGRPAAAMALLTMQTFAPSGGQGHRTSLRGGGPLTTLADPRTDVSAEPLWRLVWANVETQAQLSQRNSDRAKAWGPTDAFPWLAATRSSNDKDGGGPTTPADAAPAQVYFGLPRRIRLEVGDTPGECALTGRADTAVVTSFRMKNYGVQYTGWIHPLTPYYTTAQSGPLPVHGQPGGIGWRDWLGLLIERPDDNGSRPAQAIAQFRLKRAHRPFRLRVAGYDMDNMKARSWVQAELPAFPDADVQRVRAFAVAATAATDFVGTTTMLAVKAALLHRPKDAPGDFRFVKHMVWSTTSASFFNSITELVEQSELDGAAIRERFRLSLRRESLGVFDHFCSIDAGIDSSHLRRPIAARHSLAVALEGYGKSGAILFRHLDLASREPPRSRRGRAA
jgi:CRISPR system Cascade subunit CasA